MRAILESYYDGRLSRRGFFERLVATGLTTASAWAMVEAAERGTTEGAGSGESAGYSLSGTGGDLITEQVKAAGTRYIFANPGSLETAFYDALTDRPELEMIMGLHEGVVISMADGYHKVSGQTAFVNVHAVAGTGQMGGQMFNVHRDGSALFVTAGMNDTTAFSDDLHLAPSAGFNQIDINQQFTKLSWEVHQGASAAIAVRRAFKLAGTAPGGPVYVAFAREALAEKVTGEIWPRDTFMIDARPRPAADQLEKLARFLIEAERPAIVFGDEIWKTGAQARAVELTELLGVAAATGQQAFGNFPVHHPQYIGGLGDAARPFPFGGHDLIVQCGARDPGGMSIPDKIRSVPRYAVVGMNTEMLGRTQPFDLAVVADVHQTLGELIDAVRSLATKERLDTIRRNRLDVITAAVSAKRAEREAAARQTFNQAVIHPSRLDYELDKAIDAHAIVAMENLTGKDEFMRFGYRENEKMRLRSNGTSLGWGVGAAIGAQLAAPDRPVVLCIGDGSVMYSASGFWTMVRYEVPVLTIVWNNRNYQTVRQAFAEYKGRMAATGHYHGMHLGNPDIDFVGLAGSQGVKGERVTGASDLAGALQRGVQATREGRPYLVEVVISNYGGGAESTWYPRISAAAARKSTA